VRGVLAVLCDRFPVPRPLGSFEDASGVWEALSYLPGHEIGFDTEPSLDDVGRFLASFHAVSLELTATMPACPTGARLTQLDAVVDWDGARTTMGSERGVAELRALLDGFASDLEKVRYAELPACGVHGDATTFNVLAEGSPRRPSGLTDFDLADVEPAR